MNSTRTSEVKQAKAHPHEDSKLREVLRVLEDGKISQNQAIEKIRVIVASGSANKPSKTEA